MKLIVPMLLSVSVILTMGCSQNGRITNAGDYEPFLNKELLQKRVQHTNEQVKFWTGRLDRDTGNFVDMMKLASSHFQLFRLQGSIADFRKGDSLTRASLARLNGRDPDLLFALAQNAITRHKFSEAVLYSDSAFKSGGDLYTTRLLEFDSGMELGAFSLAASKLNSIKDHEGFDYLIRKAKLEDHNGNLDAAITLMEQAFEKVKNGKTELYCWALSNLADMYGHAGRIKDAYESYLDVLRKDSSYSYALRGIAWIAYSHDGDKGEARRLYEYLLSQTESPDLWLALAEVEDAEGNTDQKNEYYHRFLSIIDEPAYEGMYNKYMLQLYTDEYRDVDRAISMASAEVAARPTPETLDWLAWAYYNKGEKEKAFTISKQHVYRKNFEPDALYHTAVIFAANGKKKEAREMLNECLDSSFELGPVKTKEVRSQLASL